MGTQRSGARAAVKDGAIAACVAAMLLIVGLSGNHSDTDLDLLGYALLATSGLALAASRRAPLAVLAVTGLCAIGCQAIGFDAPAVAYLVAVYAAVRAGHRIITIATSATMLTAFQLIALALPYGKTTDQALAQARDALELAWLIAAGAAGEALRQAEQRADEAEHTREETARRRANEERVHIARELHDSLTHQISIIKVQAEVAVHLARKRGEHIPEALLAIQQAGREATRELRATLEALRHDSQPPTHGLDHVPELIQRARATGLDATLEINGQPHHMPTAVDRTAYRIVQESLTNIARHAAAATASIHIHYHPDTLAIQIDDDGTATPHTPPTPGVGLLGMRERVTALGGHLRAEPRHQGGFTVQAQLPLTPTP
jgi:signal transduction histidine kinase